MRFQVPSRAVTFFLFLLFFFCRDALKILRLEYPFRLCRYIDRLVLDVVVGITLGQPSASRSFDSFGTFLPLEML
jgi:hypothetical protein